ncbi:MAG: tetratricopeptide repeat protein [Pirellulaceae bacterium]
MFATNLIGRVARSAGQVLGLSRGPLQAQRDLVHRLMGHGDWLQADQAMEQVLALSEFADDYVLRASIRVRTENYAGALEDVNAALELDDSNVDAVEIKAIVLGNIAAWEESLHQWERCIQLAPDELDYKTNAAIACRNLKRLDDAFAYLSDVIAVDRHNAEALTMRASVSLERDAISENLQQVISDCQRSLKIKPNQPDLYVVLADMMLRTSDYQRSLAYCKQALQFAPHDYRAIGLRGVASCALGNIEEGIEDCTQAIDGGIEQTQVRTARAQAYVALDKLDQAMEDLNYLIQADPESIFAWTNKGHLLLRMGESQEAEIVANRAIALAPTDIDALMLQAQVLQVANKFAEASPYYDEIICQDKHNVEARMNRVICDILAGNDQRIAEDIQVALKDGALPNRVHLAVADAYLAANRYTEVVEHASLAIKADPGNVSGYFLRASAYYACEAWDRAAADWTNTMTMTTDVAYSYACRANAWLAKQDWDAFEKDVRALLKMHGDPAVLNQLYHHEVMRLIRKDQFDVALEICDRFQARQPDEALPHWLRAIVCWEAGEFVDAKEHIGLYLQHNTEVLSVKSLRGRILTELGEFDAALEDLRESIQALQAYERGPERDTQLALCLCTLAVASDGLGNKEEAAIAFRQAEELGPENGYVHYYAGCVAFQDGDHERAVRCFERSLVARQTPLPTRRRKKAEAILRRCHESSVNPAADAS